MRLSEAIRVGAQFGPQAYGDFTRSRATFFPFRRSVTAYCALGGAFKAAGCKTVSRKVTEGSTTRPFRGPVVESKPGEMETFIDFPDEWNNTMWKVAVCPQCRRNDRIFRLIPHMNDNHRMTREKIADVIEPIEIAMEREHQRVTWTARPQPEDRFLASCRDAAAQPIEPVESE